MVIKLNEIHDYDREVEFYKLTDTLGFGPHQGRSIRHTIKHHPDYVEWLLKDQIAFGLDTRAIAYYEVGPDGRDHIHPDHKIELTTTTTVFPPTEQHKPNKLITTFQPILGVNTMKRAIMVSHDNAYQPDDDMFSDDSGQQYAYLTNIDDLQIGDYVVVDCSNGLQVCRVTKLVGLAPHQIKKAYKWVVCKVDLEQHEKNKLTQEKIQEIENRVAIRKEQIEGQAILKMMAKDDPDMMALLQELGSLDKNLVPASILEAPKAESDILGK